MDIDELSILFTLLKIIILKKKYWTMGQIIGFIGCHGHPDFEKKLSFNPSDYFTTEWTEQFDIILTNDKVCLRIDDPFGIANWHPSFKCLVQIYILYDTIWGYDEPIFDLN